VMVNDSWQEVQRPEDVPRMLENLRKHGEAALTGCHWVVERHEGDGR